MWDWSEAAAAALVGGHTAVSRVDVLHNGTPVYVLAVTGGRVGMDAHRPVRANVSCALIDPTGRLSRGDVDDLLSPYDCEIQPWRGVALSSTRVAYQPSPTAGFGGTELGIPVVTRSSSVELAPLGVFGLTGRTVTDSPDGLAIALAGQDRAMGFRGPMSSALAIPGGTPVEAAITRLLLTRRPGLSLLAMDTGFTCGPLLFPPDIDVWAEAQKLAESVGVRLFHDRLGRCVLAPAGPASGSPVARYAEGAGLLLSVDRAEDADTIRNVVVAESPDGRIRVEVADTDPSSPTSVGGRFGRRVAPPLVHPFTSHEQARQAAMARLVHELGRSETVAFTAIVNPGLDVDEVVTVHRPRAGLVDRGVIVATLDVPLSVKEPMQVVCRQSRLAQDGRGLPPTELAA